MNTAGFARARPQLAGLDTVCCHAAKCVCMQCPPVEETRQAGLCLFGRLGLWLSIKLCLRANPCPLYCLHLLVCLVLFVCHCGSSAGGGQVIAPGGGHMHLPKGKQRHIVGMSGLHILGDATCTSVVFQWDMPGRP